jgi:hypothetical protein
MLVGEEGGSGEELAKAASAPSGDTAGRGIPGIPRIR